MASKLTPEQRPAFVLANLLHDTANAIKVHNDAAYDAGKITLEDYIDNVGRETEIRTIATNIVARDLSNVVREVSDAGARIEEAIEEANARIAEVKKLKDGIAIFAAVIALATAVSQSNVPAAIAAANELRKVAKSTKATKRGGENG